MRKYLLCGLLACTATIVSSQTLEQVESKKVTLPNGWNLTPVGRSLPLGDLPLNIAVSKSKSLMAVTNNGQSVQSIQLIDPATETILDTKVVGKAWYGLAFSADEKKLYASGNHDNWIMVFTINNKKLVLTDSIILGKKWPNKISPTGIAVDDEKQLLYVVTKEDNKLYSIDLATKQIQTTYQLSGEAYACLLSPDNKQLYISCWGCDKVLVFSTVQKNIVAEIPVGDNPNELCLTKKGKYLYVANANDNSVSVISTAENKVIETLNSALYPDAPSGSTTNGLALSADEKTLFIANADNNCLSVFDVSKPIQSKSKGFIPVGWYPTNVKVIGKKIFVSNGKGFSSMANPYGPNPFGNKQTVLYQEGDPNKPKNVQYIAGLFQGTMSIIDMPTEAQLSVFSQVVYRNTPYNKVKELLVQGEEGNPIPRRVGAASPIKYVFYIIKENRTYDQVLGDMKEGNGDPRLVLFGENITPNQHALAREFVLLDNFYVDGEVSADGHNWSTGAYATDFLEKNWVTSYGGRGGGYDAEGNRAVANNKGGFIWDHCKKASVSYRTYGEFADNYKANIPALKDHFCPYFTGYNNAVPDTTRFFQWKREFDSLLSVNAVPRFNSVRFCNDHTEGLRLGRPTPYAHVADNDLAVGMFVEYLSKSPIWKETAVFILEDDAQNGADHVDAHRSIAFVAGGFVKRGFVDHTMYSTSSMLRTMELILGIPPMSQYDAAATPMWRSFTNTPNTKTFTAVVPQINLKDKNTAMNEWQRRSEKFDLTKEDAVPDLEFNVVLWYGLKGSNIPFPGPKRAAFFKSIKKADKDND
ncbi:MAG: bifunctional YncE family protein/alkaline phosphatase family protein [Chitinophagaceae bacterium]|nr:bifunctional YncE family protein/alkaline phosphatase family protein [Chitinophagaceae bacterium]MCA6447839.1 bifunctional YncE family protein/alkaline phosphatase family protein [Chitinophagaceae bacterium]